MITERDGAWVEHGVTVRQPLVSEWDATGSPQWRIVAHGNRATSEMQAIVVRGPGQGEEGEWIVFP